MLDARQPAQTDRADPTSLDDRLERVRDTLREFPRVLIAFSGGVDSTLLAKLAREALGRDRVLAATADSPSLAREDLREAQRLAAELDIEHLVVPTHELANPEYQANAPTRCYFCKRELFEELDAVARERAIPAILYGAIGDDRADERPGQAAARERGIHAPLQAAGLAKFEVREAARRLGLSNWNRPQNACLSSRIPHGEAVTEAKLAQIEQAEARVRALGFHQVRVRHHGPRARVEVGRDELPRLADAGLRERIEQALRGCGFDAVEIDPQGYHSTGADATGADV